VQKVEQYLQKKRMKFVSGVRLRPNTDTVLLTVPESALSKAVTADKTSRRQLHFLQKAIKRDLSIEVDFMISKGQAQEELEAGLAALLKLRFPSVAQSCFISSVETGIVEVWLEETEAKVVELPPDMEKAFSEYLRVFGLTLGKIHHTGFDKELPSPLAVLRALKATSPSLPEAISGILEGAGFLVPPKRWMDAKLDWLRKQHLVLRRNDGCYVMTESGLRVIPHGQGSSSSDVQRALALARRKW
jgi:hypothetical protein